MTLILWENNMFKPL